VSDDELAKNYQGTVFKIVHCNGAIESYKKALDSVPKHRHAAFTRGLIQQIKRLANGERMSKENFPAEGELPNRKGQHVSKKFYAFKRIPLRGYCWLSESHNRTYYISHYIYKNHKKLKEVDTKTVGNNWRRIEVNNHER